MIYTDFDFFLMPENKKSKIQMCHKNKYQINASCSHGYKLVCVHNLFSKSYKSDLSKDLIHECFNSMLKESHYCSNFMKKLFQ